MGISDENRGNNLISQIKVNQNHVKIFSGKPINTLRPRQNGRLFADDTFKRIFLNENIIISIKISLFVPKGFINNIPALVLIMAWRRPGDNPLSEPMMVRTLTHICVTRPRWVKNTLSHRPRNAKMHVHFAAFRMGQKHVQYSYTSLAVKASFHTEARPWAHYEVSGITRITSSMLQPTSPSVMIPLCSYNRTIISKKTPWWLVFFTWFTLQFESVLEFT